jgi:FkbM family methyltransferase
MELFRELVPRGSVVLEIGGHIGYVTQYFAMLTGPGGQVFCFEPSPENVSYLRTNASNSTQRNITVIEAAAGEVDGVVTFYYESITGQNSTLVSDFKGLEINSGFNGLPADYKICSVSMRSVDSFLAERGVQADFIKIDAEGAEYRILQGMQRTIGTHPRIMVEVNGNHAEVFERLTQAGYLLFNEARVAMLSSDPNSFGYNIFCVHAEDLKGVAILNRTSSERQPETLG